MGTLLDLFDKSGFRWGRLLVQDQEIIEFNTGQKEMLLNHNFQTYTFTCDPEECDALIEFTARDGFGFPSGEVSMKCPCGRKMNYIQMRESEHYV